MAGGQEHPGMRREHRTVGLLMGLYCQQVHRHPAGLCEESRELLYYAQLRLARIPF